MEKENKVPVVEIILIVVGALLHSFNAPADFAGFLGGLIGMSLGAIFIGYIPYSLLKDKIQNAKIKVFSVVFFLLNLLVLVASQPM